MRIIFLLLLCNTFLNVFGQNFPSANIHPKHVSYITNSQQGIHGHTPQRPAMSPAQYFQSPDRLNALGSVSGIQVIDSIYIWDWDSVTQAWFIDYRIIDIIYSSGFLPEHYIAQYYDGNTWTNDYRYTLAYDANNQMTRETEEFWTGDDWEFEYQTLFTYNEHQHLTSETYESWGGDFWKISGRELFTYDTAQQLISILLQDLNVDVYENTSQILYSYDMDGNRIYELGQYWFETGWFDNFQVFNTFDHLSNQLFDLVQYYDGINWINNSQSGFNYDAQNNRIYHLQQTWNGVEWENDRQYYYTYDATQNPATELEEKWNGTDWDTNSTVSYTHDLDNFRESEVYSYYTPGGTLASFADSTHYYYHTVTGLKEATSTYRPLVLSPNPTTGHFTIEHEEEIISADVYNLTGVLIAHTAPSPDINKLEIDISGHIPGIYIVQIRTASFVQCARVMLH